MFDKYYRKAKYVFKNLKELGLSTHCQRARSELIMLITNNDIMSERLSSKLIPSAWGRPYQINNDDSEQVLVLKKIVNILYHVECILVEIENIDFSNDKSLTEFLINNTPMLVKNVYKAINQLYDAVQLINNSGSTLQAMLGPQFNKLKPQFDRAYEQLMEFTSKGVESINEETLGENISTKISLLPKKNTRVEDISFDDLGSLIHSIPDYLKKLQDLIDNNPLPEKANMNTEEYQCVLEKRAKKLANDLEQLTTKTSLPLSYQYIQILKQLGALALDVVNVGASLNKSAYKKAVTKLKEFKHIHLPKIICELEILEENFGLKTGTLTKNTLDSANKYYQKLAESVDKMAVVAGVFDKIELHGNRLYGQLAQELVLGDSKKIVTGQTINRDEQITTLFDTSFIEKRQMLQLERLNCAKEHLHEAQESEKAAIAFFEKLDTVNKFYKQKYFSSISIDDRQELAHLYQQFQSYMAEIDPAFDQKMVHYLTLTTKEEEQLKQGKTVTSSFLGSVLGGMSTLTRFSIAVVNNVITPFIPSPETEFKLVLQKQNQIFTAIKKEIATESQRIDLIEESMKYADESTYKITGEKTVLKTIDTALPDLITFKYEKDKSAQEYYKKFIALEKQLEDLTEAREAFHSFIKDLKKLSKNDELSEEKKEELRVKYKKFQRFIVYQSKTYTLLKDLDAKIVTALMSDKSKGKQEILQLLQFEMAINHGFNNLLINSREDKKLYLMQDLEARKQPRELIKLKPIGSTKKTLLSQLSELKLSGKVADYLENTLLPYLLDNLSPEILQALDQNLPYTKIYQDSERIRLYKNLINAFYHLANGLSKLENQGTHEYTENTLSRVSFLTQVASSTGPSIYQAMISLKAFAGNPQLNSIIQEGLALVAPMKQIPILSVYFNGNLKQKTVNQKQVHVKKIADEIHSLQLSLVNLIGNVHIEKKPEVAIQTARQALEHYKLVKNNFITENKKYLRTLESTYQLKKGSLNLVLVHRLNQNEKLIRKEVNELANVENILYSLQKLYYFCSNDDFSKIQEKAKKFYELLLPYLEKIDPEYYSKDFLINLKNASDYEKALCRLAKRDGKALLIQVGEEKLNILHTYLLKKTHQLSAFVLNTKNMISESELNIDKKEPMEQRKSKSESTEKKTESKKNVIKQLVSGLYQAQATVHQWLSPGFIKFPSQPDLQILTKYQSSQYILTNDAFYYYDADNKMLTSILESNILGDYAWGLFVASLNIDPKENLTKTELNKIQMLTGHNPHIDNIDNIERMVDGFAQIGIKPTQVAKFLNTIKELQVVLNNTTYDAHHLVLKNLNALRLEFTSTIIKYVDEIEYNLGLQPGTLSSEVNTRFDKFYKGFLSGLVLSSDQNNLELLIDTSHIRSRIQHEQNRLEKLKTTSRARTLREQLQGSKSVNLNELNIIDDNLESVQLTQENVCVIEQLKILLIQSKKNSNLFDQQDAKEKFLDCYKELVPLLILITGKQPLYHRFMIGSLKETGSKEDFKQALSGILIYEPAFNELINASVKTDEMNIKLREERIKYLEEQLSDAEKKVPEKIQQFKESKFEECIDIKIRGMLDDPLGPYSVAFLKQIKLILNNIQSQVLNDLSLEDDIEEKIAERLIEQFNQLMKVQNNETVPVLLTPFLSEEQLNNLHSDYLIFHAANDNYSKINKVKEQFKDKVKSNENNSFIRLVIGEIELFEKQVQQSVKDYSPINNDKLPASIVETTKFLKQLDSYKFIMEDTDLNDQYNDLQQQKIKLTESLRMENPIIKQKYDFIEGYEKSIIEFVKKHEKEKVQAEIQAFHRKLKVYDELTDIYSLNEKVLKELGDKDNLELTKVDNNEIKRVTMIGFAKKIREKILTVDEDVVARKNSVTQMIKDELKSPTLGEHISEFFTALLISILNIFSRNEEKKPTVVKFSLFTSQYKNKVKSEDKLIVPSY